MFINGYVCTIEKKDVGRTMLKIGQHRILITSFMGKIMDCDIGKQIYYNNGIYQVENQEQMEGRIIFKGKGI